MKKKPYRIFLYYLLVGIRFLFNIFPYSILVRMGKYLGRFAFYIISKERARTLNHLSLAFGNEKTPEELKKIARGVFENFGMILMETNFIHKILSEIDRWVVIEGSSHIDEALKKGKGIVGLVAHFGDWELMGGYLTMKGYPLTVIARKIYYEKYNELLMEVRQKMGVQTIYRDESPRKMLQVLKKNEILAFVADQDVEAVDGVFVNFFGQPAYTPVAPVRFAMATGSALIPAFIIRQGYKHKIIIRNPLELVNTQNIELDTQVNTQAWVAVQESFIRQYPDHWVWNHRRWKTRP